MGLLDNLERGIEKAVRGAFSGRGGSLGPVEIATAVRRHMDRESFTMSQGRSFVPNVYRIRLSPDDFAEAKKYGVALAEELCEEIIRHADSQGYTLRGPVRATFVKNTDLRRGQLHIESSTEKGAVPSAHPVAATAPAAGSHTGLSAGQPAAPAAPSAPSSYDLDATTVNPAVTRAPRVLAVVEHDGTRHELEAHTVVGRSSQAGISIADSGISRRHMEIYRQGDHFYARDLGSTNGTYVDGERLDPQAPGTELFDSALISLGGARLRFRTVTES